MWTGLTLNSEQHRNHPLTRDESRRSSAASAAGGVGPPELGQHLGADLFNQRHELDRLGGDGHDGGKGQLVAGQGQLLRPLGRQDVLDGKVLRLGAVPAVPLELGETEEGVGQLFGLEVERLHVLLLVHVVVVVVVVVVVRPPGADALFRPQKVLGHVVDRLGRDVVVDKLCRRLLVAVEYVRGDQVLAPVWRRGVLFGVEPELVPQRVLRPAVRRGDVVPARPRAQRRRRREVVLRGGAVVGPRDVGLVPHPRRRGQVVAAGRSKLYGARSWDGMVDVGVLDDWLAAWRKVGFRRGQVLLAWDHLVSRLGRVIAWRRVIVGLGREIVTAHPAVVRRVDWTAQDRAVFAMVVWQLGRQIVVCRWLIAGCRGEGRPADCCHEHVFSVRRREVVFAWRFVVCLQRPVFGKQMGRHRGLVALVWHRR